MSKIKDPNKPHMTTFTFMIETDELYKFRIAAVEKKMTTGRLTRELIRSYNTSREQD